MGLEGVPYSGGSGVDSVILAPGRFPDKLWLQVGKTGKCPGGAW